MLAERRLGRVLRFYATRYAGEQEYPVRLVRDRTASRKIPVFAAMQVCGKIEAIPARGKVGIGSIYGIIPRMWEKLG